MQVSYSVYDKAKDNPAFRFVERGEVFCKGVGNVRTFFVEDASLPSVPITEEETRAVVRTSTPREGP